MLYGDFLLFSSLFLLSGFCFINACCVWQGMLFVFAVLVFALELLFHACTVCFTRIVVSICMFGYTCMLFGGVVDLLFTNVFGFVCGFSITITDIFDVVWYLIDA